ncbi:MAG: 50S ribosomal protein L24 [Candidatus Saganbacteria bacterium]|nr:50S ribosomal protein L24 [Candidatus Saganbacteria bacterium]
MQKLKIKKGDKVVVLSGKDKDKKGKVLRVYSADRKAVVESVNIVKKHQRPTQGFQGGIIDRPMALKISKLMLVCPRCNKPVRVGRKLVDEKNVRVCRKCKEVIDKQ